MKSRNQAVLLIAFILFYLYAPALIQAQLINVPIKTPAEDRAFSEFNHHLAGAFLLALGVLAFLSKTSFRLRILGKVWPFLFTLAGIYLAFMSDPDVWPMGGQGIIDAFLTNPEAAEHKTYAALLLALGALEFQRERGKLGRFLSVWSFPMLAAFGGVFLMFHSHTVMAPPEMTEAMKGMEGMGNMGGGMTGHGHAMTGTMMKIQREHIGFSIVGAGVAISKFVYDGGFLKNRVLPFIWPACISILGVMLLLYTE